MYMYMYMEVHMYMYIGAVVTNHNGTKCLAVNTSTYSLITIVLYIIIESATQS